MIKRFTDIILSSLLLLFFLPIFVAVAIFVFIFLGSPVFYRQRRPGLNAKIFKIIKFRTMNDKKDINGDLLADNLRLTRFGKFLRATSLDELPELWNVLKGDMSIVGPRPLLEEYLELYDKDQYRRHLVRPGITGLAQVSGRNTLSWEEKFKYDIWYVENHNLILDIKILLKTIFKVILRDGINQGAETTADKFYGN